MADTAYQSSRISIAAPYRKGVWALRLVQSLRLLFLLLLSLSLYCGELPESLILTDDGANDFVESSTASVSVAGEFQRVHRNPAAAPWGVPAEGGVRHSPFGLPIKPALTSGLKLLRLLSIQRK